MIFSNIFTSEKCNETISCPALGIAPSAVVGVIVVVFVNRVRSSTSLNGTGQETRHRYATGPKGMDAECTGFASCCDCNKEAFWTLGAPQESLDEGSKEENN